MIESIPNDVSEMKELAWGETPWDDMPRDQLLRTLQTLYSAVVSADSVLFLLRMEHREGFWGAHGSGGRAYMKTNQARKLAEAGFTDEVISRAYFRYADDLLFTAEQKTWLICPDCGRMYGHNATGLAGKLCETAMAGAIPCSGVLRHITWEDLAKKESLVDDK